MNRHTILVIFILILVFIILPLCILGILDKKMTLNLICTSNTGGLEENIYYRPIKKELLIDDLDMNEYSDKWNVEQSSKKFIIKKEHSFDYTNCSDIQLEFSSEQCKAKIRETDFVTISIDKYSLNYYYSYLSVNTDTKEEIRKGGYFGQCQFVKKKI